LGKLETVLKGYFCAKQPNISFETIKLKAT